MEANKVPVNGSITRRVKGVALQSIQRSMQMEADKPQKKTSDVSKVNKLSQLNLKRRSANCRRRQVRGRDTLDTVSLAVLVTGHTPAGHLNSANDCAAEKSIPHESQLSTTADLKLRCGAAISRSQRVDVQ